jgi:RNA polymerase sigma factor (sigma-70 family)
LAVAYRVLGHHWRSASRRSRLNEKLAGIGSPPALSPEDLIVVAHDSEQILSALDRLREKDQEFLRLSIWEELNHAEIAEMFNLSEEAVRKRLSRARKSLAREYDRLEKIVAPAAQEGGAL